VGFWATAEIESCCAGGDGFPEAVTARIVLEGFDFPRGPTAETLQAYRVEGLRPYSFSLAVAPKSI
jgi:hypothetical protein